MNKNIKVIQHYGRPVVAEDGAGNRIVRKERIFLPSHGQWYPTMDMDNHFIYESNDKSGSSVLCTCGSIAVTAGYHAYKKWMSPSGEVLCCHSLIVYGHHANNST
jgi:hypothetical protein